jgi:hypothetical protein
MKTVRSFETSGRARGQTQHENRFESQIPALFHFQRIKRQLSRCTIRILCYSVISFPFLAFVTQATGGLAIAIIIIIIIVALLTFFTLPPLMPPPPSLSRAKPKVSREHSAAAAF